MRSSNPLYSRFGAHRDALYRRSDLIARVYQHRTGAAPGFTKKYRAHRLVWFEQHGTMDSAILREKQLKKWNRAWKLRVIEETNSAWRDLAEDFGFEPLPPSGFPPSRE